MSRSTNEPIVFYPLLAICMCLDFFGMFWFSAPVIYSVIALLAVSLSHPTSNKRLLVILTALALESFLIYGQWGAQLAFLIPITLIARTTWSRFTHPMHHSIIIVTGSLLAQAIVTDSLMHSNILSIFTLTKILINILLTISISLTYM